MGLAAEGLQTERKNVGKTWGGIFQPQAIEYQTGNVQDKHRVKEQSITRCLSFFVSEGWRSWSEKARQKAAQRPRNRAAANPKNRKPQEGEKDAAAFVPLWEAHPARH